jgi:hypothetical protein
MRWIELGVFIELRILKGMYLGAKVHKSLPTRRGGE